MKNIHILPTEEPSRLIIYSTLLNEFRLLDEPIVDWKHKKNLYITSDEEIKEGDCFINTSSDSIHKSNGTEIFDYRKGYQVCFKIILTTDTKLIVDGVQSIDDEFLEWFVKNPTCEEVSVEKECCGQCDERLCEIKDLQQEETRYNNFYKIIIPKEPFKHEATVIPVEEIMTDRCNAYEFIDFDKQGSMSEAIKQVITDKLKQETLEEFSLSKVNKIFGKGIDDHMIAVYCTLIHIGAKWQQERSYSEEEVKQFARSYYREIKLDISNLQWNDLADKCFEQFKKK
jgi:hypothetical protein